jgi:hypothetical protein
MKFFKFIKSSVACIITIGVCGLLMAGCKKGVQAPLPTDRIVSGTVFQTDKSTAGVLNNIYGYFSSGTSIFDGSNGIGFNTGLYADELQPSNANATSKAFYSDNVAFNYTSSYWVNMYSQLYALNSALEQLPATAGLQHKSQWLGEAYFMRAFIYFYLVNLYGDVPLAIASDYKVNNALTRSARADVYKQIIADLLQAQSLLQTNYADVNGNTTTDKTRPNNATATALLARVYLYTGDWANAEKQATLVINTNTLPLPALNQVFLANSTETIWALAKDGNSFVNDYAAYNNNVPTVIPANQNIGTLIPGILSTPFVNTFEPGDQRLKTWVRTATTVAAPVTTYYLANKYQSQVTNVEYLMLFRMAEQYLIRAEARAQQNNLAGAKTDIDIVRIRAGLAGVTISNQAAMLTAILHERQVELFTELGHRFFDLRRTATLDAVMTPLAPQKGGTWASFKQWWPIPNQDIVANPNLIQTPGY